MLHTFEFPGRLTLNLPGTQRSLEELLVQEGLITEDDLAVVLTVRARTGQRLETILLEQGLITQSDYMKLLSRKLETVRRFSKTAADFRA